MTSDGVITKRLHQGVDEAVRRLVQIIDARDIELFTIVDHSGAAEAAGLQMPNTKLVLFGKPAVGTPIMLDTPVVALDLPLKVLVWEDADGAGWISYNEPDYLAGRHHLDGPLEAALEAAVSVTNAVVNDNEK